MTVVRHRTMNYSGMLISYMYILYENITFINSLTTAILWFKYSNLKENSNGNILKRERQVNCFIEKIDDIASLILEHLWRASE